MSEYQLHQCPLCDLQFQSGTGATFADWTFEILCSRCGHFTMPNDTRDDFFSQARKGFAEKRYLISAIVKTTARPRSEPLSIDTDFCQRIEAGLERDRTVPEKTEFLLRWFAAESIHPGSSVTFDADLRYPVAFCRNAAECQFFLRDARDRGLLDIDEEAQAMGNAEEEVTITTRGWEWIAERPQAAGDRVFIAMSFSDDFKPTGLTIEAAIRAAGYDPKRVDKHEYLGGVMDEVLALIRKSRFVVADFTGNRGGVYYEAAFAAGLGIPVIPTCRADHLDEQKAERLHFDVRHLNFLGWDANNLPDFQQRLRNRIEGTLGRGPRPHG